MPDKCIWEESMRILSHSLMRVGWKILSRIVFVSEPSTGDPSYMYLCVWISILTIIQRWLSNWLGAKQVNNNHLSLWWPSLMSHSASMNWRKSLATWTPTFFDVPTEMQLVLFNSRAFINNLKTWDPNLRELIGYNHTQAILSFSVFTVCVAWLIIGHVSLCRLFNILCWFCECDMNGNFSKVSNTCDLVSCVYRFTYTYHIQTHTSCILMHTPTRYVYLCFILVAPP